MVLTFELFIMENFLNYFIDFSAFSSGNTAGIVYSIINSMLLVVPVWGVLYLLWTLIKLMNAGGRPEKSMQMRNATLLVTTILIISYAVYGIMRFITDKYLLMQ